jgi:hypothetical protein
VGQRSAPFRSRSAAIGVFRRCQISECAVRSDVVVVVLPGDQHGANPDERGEQCLVEQFIAYGLTGSSLRSRFSRSWKRPDVEKGLRRAVVLIWKVGRAVLLTQPQQQAPNHRRDRRNQKQERTCAKRAH